MEIQCWVVWDKTRNRVVMAGHRSRKPCVFGTKAGAFNAMLFEDHKRFVPRRATLTVPTAGKGK